MCVCEPLQVEAQQKEFKLKPAELKVKVEDSKIQEIIVSLYVFFVAIVN